MTTYMYVVYSAQCVLREFTVGDVMSMEIDQLKSNFPWMPTKVVEVQLICLVKDSNFGLSCVHVCTYITTCSKV